MRINQKPTLNISSGQIIEIFNNILNCYDTRLAHHGERVTYIAYNIFSHLKRDDIDLGLLLLMSTIHDIGAYKTDEVNKLVEFECEGILPHCVYGYLLLKYSGVFDEDTSKILLYHHKCSFVDTSFTHKLYSDIIFLADRFDIMFYENQTTADILSDVEKLGFDNSLIGALKDAMNSDNFLTELRNKNCLPIIKKILEENKTFATYAYDVLLLAIFTIDFKSEVTMLHSFAVAQVSTYAGEKMGLGKLELDKLSFAALVHDIGKVAIPTEILESTAKYDEKQFEIMKKHVDFTEKILNNVIPQDIVQLAARHHEKVDGSGYPRGLTGVEMSLSDKIMAVADIFAALTNKRNYKNAFDKKSVQSIIGSMLEKNLLDEEVSLFFINNYDDIFFYMADEEALLMASLNKMKDEFLHFTK